MLSHRTRALRLGLELGDGFTAGLCLFAAAALGRSDLLAGEWLSGSVNLSDDLYLCAAIAAMASTRALRWSGAYSGSGHQELPRVLGRLARGWAATALGLLGAGLVFGLESLSLALVALYAPIHLAGLIAWRFVALSWLRPSRKRDRNQRTFLTIGSDSRARRVAARFTADWGFRNLGFLDDTPVSLDVEAVGKRYLGSAKELERLLEREIIDEVVIVLPRHQLGADSTIEAIRLCETVGLDVTILSDLFDAQRAKRSYHEVLGAPAISFRSYQLPPLWALAVKRGVDILGAVLGLVITFPLWLIVAAAIKLDSPGPVFFVQKRSGLHGRTFPFPKFRTMARDAERNLAGLREYNEVTGPVFKMTNDPRVTRVGHFLRRTSIDELPQLISVLLGQMSLVGPRPPIPGEVDQYELFQRRRLSVRPGLTCLWQISGRSLVGFEDWVRLDLQYVYQWSLMQHHSILLRTIPAVLTRRGAR